MRRREQELLNKIKEQQKALETMKQEKMKVSVLHIYGHDLRISVLSFDKIFLIIGCVGNSSLR